MRIRNANGSSSLRFSALVAVIAFVMATSLWAQRVPDPPREGGRFPDVVVTDQGGSSLQGTPWWVISIPGIPNPGSGIGNPGGTTSGGHGSSGSSGNLVLYEDNCSCTKTSTYNTNTLNDLAPSYIKALAANLADCDRHVDGGQATETYTTALSYKVSAYVTPGTSDKNWICRTGTISSYDLLETWIHKHCTKVKIDGVSQTIPEVTFTWSKPTTKSGTNAQSDVDSFFGRCSQ